MYLNWKKVQELNEEEVHKQLYDETHRIHVIENDKKNSIFYTKNTNKNNRQIDNYIIKTARFIKVEEKTNPAEHPSHRGELHWGKSAEKKNSEENQETLKEDTEANKKQKREERRGVSKET